MTLTYAVARHVVQNIFSVNSLSPYDDGGVQHEDTSAAIANMDAMVVANDSQQGSPAIGSFSWVRASFLLRRHFLRRVAHTAPDRPTTLTPCTIVLLSAVSAGSKSIQRSRSLYGTIARLPETSVGGSCCAPCPAGSNGASVQAG
jgi:hypothetical protein